MNGHEQAAKKSRVVKIDSEQTWDFFMTQAENQGCPVMVHFAATWCMMPSVAMKEFFEELALSYQDILFLSIDVDDVKGVAVKMKIKAMPTFVLVKEGAEADRIVGANPDEIKKRVTAFVLNFRNLNKSST